MSLANLEAAVLRAVRDRRVGELQLCRRAWADCFRGGASGSASPKCTFAWATTNSTTRTSPAAASVPARATTWSGFRWKTRYPLLRRYFWLMTDSAYKSAVEAISRKRAALRNMQQSEQLNDFAHAEPVKHRASRSPTLSMDEEAVGRHGCGRCRRFSRSIRRSRIRASNWNRAPAASPGQFGRHRSARAGERQRSCACARSRRRPTA